jgi:hypothetical protein
LFELLDLHLALFLRIVWNDGLELLDYDVYSAPFLVVVIEVQRHEGELVILIEEPRLSELVNLINTVSILK